MGDEGTERDIRVLDRLQEGIKLIDSETKRKKTDSGWNFFNKIRDFITPDSNPLRTVPRRKVIFL